MSRRDTRASLTPPVGPRDHVAGPNDAPLTLVEYGDYQCPHCGRAYPIVKDVQRALGSQLRFLFRNFPLTKIHPEAEHAAEAAEAAGAQGAFWQMHDRLFERQFALDDDHLVEYAAELGLNADRIRGELDAAVVAGVSDFRIIRAHIIPNAIAPVLAQLSINVGWSILLTAALSFVGAGVRAPTPEWGSMIATGFQNVMTGQWWPSVMPGIALAVTVFGFALVGTSIEFLADPSSRRRLAERARTPKPNNALDTASA